MLTACVYKPFLNSCLNSRVVPTVFLRGGVTVVAKKVYLTQRDCKINDEKSNAHNFEQFIDMVKLTDKILKTPCYVKNNVIKINKHNFGKFNAMIKSVDIIVKNFMLT